jgi:hypothetical protein
MMFVMNYKRKKWNRRNPPQKELPINPTNAVVLVRKRIIPTERPPLLGEVSANFSG